MLGKYQTFHHELIISSTLIETLYKELSCALKAISTLFSCSVTLLSLKCLLLSSVQIINFLLQSEVSNKSITNFQVILAYKSTKFSNLVHLVFK
ncbi:MAG: hypothetical protein LBQ24_01580 [Candidatus Peribacteria bacterium]|nr:hypothetical protein [Candidatus Peribacteria bacterium]